MASINPRPLVSGDEVYIISTARFVEPEFIAQAEGTLRNWGYFPVLSPHLMARDHQFAGTDAERLEDLNKAISNPNCRAIICARGGYGTARIIDKMDLDALRHDPKWIIGFSDITALHSHIYTQLNMESIHATMPVNFATTDADSLDTLRRILGGQPTAYRAAEHPLNRTGEAEGELIGGNLSVLYSLLGSKSSLDTDGKILFLEDLDEYLYHIDRMMVALRRAGKLSKLAGLIVGGMNDMNDNTVPFGKTAEEIIAANVRDDSYPVCFNFPSGHIPANHAWIHGKKIKLTVNNGQPSTTNYL